MHWDGLVRAHKFRSNKCDSECSYEFGADTSIQIHEFSRDLYSCKLWWRSSRDLALNNILIYLTYVLHTTTHIECTPTSTVNIDFEYCWQDLIIRWSLFGTFRSWDSRKRDAKTCWKACEWRLQWCDKLKWKNFLSLDPLTSGALMVVTYWKFAMCNVSCLNWWTHSLLCTHCE